MIESYLNINKYTSQPIKIGIWTQGQSIYRRVIPITVPNYDGTTGYGGVNIYNVTNSLDFCISYVCVVNLNQTSDTTEAFNQVVLPAFKNDKRIIGLNTINNTKDNTIKMAIFNQDPTNEYANVFGVCTIDYILKDNQ